MQLLTCNIKFKSCKVYDQVKTIIFAQYVSVIIVVTDISAHGFEQHIVIFAAGSSEVQFMISQGSARPDVRSELYEELKARI